MIINLTLVHTLEQSLDFINEHTSDKETSDEYHLMLMQGGRTIANPRNGQKTRRCGQRM